MNKELKNCEDLEDLLDLLQNHNSEDEHGRSKYEDDLCDLPTFGGTPPTDTSGIWSWDKTRLLVGDDFTMLEIVDRIEHQEMQNEQAEHRTQMLKEHFKN